MNTNKYLRLSANTLSSPVVNKLKAVLTFSFSDNLRFHKRLSLERLSYLALGDTLLNQFEVNPKKALNFLLDTQLGLLVIGKMLTPIEVGVVYQSDEDDGVSDLPEVLEDEIDNEFTFTVSGRHRITGLLTWAYANGIDPKDVMLPVSVSYYPTWEDAALSVLAANGSRTMTPTEKLNVVKQSQQIDTQNIQQLAGSADSNKHAKEAFILMVSCPAVAEKLSLQRNTVASIARAFITHLSRKHKEVLTWFSNVEVLTKVGGLFVSSLEGVLKTTIYTNIARYATTIGKEVFENIDLSNVGEPEKTQPSLEVKQQLHTKEVLENEQQQQQPTIEQTVEPATDAGTTDDDLF